MTAKEYLLQVHKLDVMIRNLDDEIQKLRAEEVSVRSTWPDGQPHGSGTTDPTGTMAIKLADQLSDLEDSQMELRSKLWHKRNEIILTIGKLERPEHNRLLFLRYVDGCTWEEIAVDMHYTYQWVAGPLHGNALQELEKIINK